MIPPILEAFPLLRGSHSRRDDGMCAMEMVAWLAGESHSDEPSCTCPVLAAYARAFNDLLPDARSRDRWLRPMVPRLINTRVRDRAIVWARAFRAADAAAREFAPATLDALGRPADAAKLRELGPVADRASAAVATAVLGPLGPAVRPATWTVAQARAAQPPRIWVAGALHQARAADSWGLAQQVLRRMIETGLQFA